MSIQCSRCITGCNDAEWHWLKTGPSQTGQLPGRIKSELCDLSGLRIDLISRLLSLSRLYSGILHSLSLSLSCGLCAKGPEKLVLTEMLSSGMGLAVRLSLIWFRLKGDTLLCGLAGAWARV